jgi:hypothetical protein
MNEKSVFGFPPMSGPGDFLPIIKYDARAGRMFRIDRVDTGNGFVQEAVDITSTFKAICDFENIEVGWMDFAPNRAPSFALIPMGSGELPPRPSDIHKHGVRFMLKLAVTCAGDKPIREITGASKAFISSIEAIFVEYQKDAPKNPGKLPVLILEKTTPVKSGSGEKQSTNYHPTFKIIGWALRGDLVFLPKGNTPAGATGGTQGHTGGTPPSTGSTVAPPPPNKPQVSETVGDDDFG